MYRAMNKRPLKSNADCNLILSDYFREGLKFED